MLWSTQTQLGSQFLEIYLNISSMHLGEKNMHCSTAFHLNSMQGSWFWKKPLNRGKWSLKKNMHFLPHDYLTPIYLSHYILLHPKTLLVFPSKQLHYSFAYFTNTWHACIYKIFKRNSWGLPLVHYCRLFLKKLKTLNKDFRKSLKTLFKDFSYLRSFGGFGHDSAPAALTSLLFDSPDTRIIGKTQHFATSLTFGADVSSFFWLSRYCIFFLLTLLHLLTLLSCDFTSSICFSSAFQLSILSEVYYLNFLRLSCAISKVTCWLSSQCIREFFYSGKSW